VLALAGTAALSSWFPLARVAFATLTLAYAALAVGCGFATARKQGLACALTLPFLFVTIHTSYGFGFLQGVAHHLLRLGRRPRDHAALALTR